MTDDQKHEPVGGGGWQVKDYADGWISVGDYDAALKLSAEMGGANMRRLSLHSEPVGWGDEANTSGFKRGDKLICVKVDPAYPGLGLNLHYTVVRAAKDYVSVAEVSQPNGWANYHFAPLPSEPPVDEEYSSLGLKSPTHPALTWQPIATAPLDGTVIDLWVDGRRMPDVFWKDDNWCTSVWSMGRQPNAKNAFRKTTHHVGLAPSHWMPRPDAPSVQQALSAGTERSDCEITPNTAPVDEGERESLVQALLKAFRAQEGERFVRNAVRLDGWFDFTAIADAILAPLLAKLKAGEEEREPVGYALMDTRTLKVHVGKSYVSLQAASSGAKMQSNRWRTLVVVPLFTSKDILP